MTATESEQAYAGCREAFDLYIVGLGTVGVTQITKEVEQALSRCKVIYYLDPSLGVPEYLNTLSPRVISLADCYVQSENRLRAYERMAALAIESALRTPPVAVAFYGHPRVYVYPTQLVLEAAAHLELVVSVLPGISTIDAMLIDIGLDPGVDGLQMFEATDALLRKRPLQNDVPCLLLQVGALETGLASTKPSRPARFTRFAAYLSEFYPSTHLISLVSTSTFRLSSSRVLTFPLGELLKRCSDVTPDMTLYIPPHQLRTIRDEQLRDDLMSIEHLSKIVAS